MKRNVVGADSAMNDATRTSATTFFYFDAERIRIRLQVQTQSRRRVRLSGGRRPVNDRKIFSHFRREL
jgi:hypothetical protein